MKTNERKTTTRRKRAWLRLQLRLQVQQAAPLRRPETEAGDSPQVASIRFVRTRRPPAFQSTKAWSPFRFPASNLGVLSTP